VRLSHLRVGRLFTGSALFWPVAAAVGSLSVQRPRVLGILREVKNKVGNKDRKHILAGSTYLPAPRWQTYARRSAH
jgi:hypothetical protein